MQTIRPLPDYLAEPLRHMLEEVHANGHWDPDHEDMRRLGSMFKYVLQHGWSPDEVSQAVELSPAEFVAGLAQEARGTWWPPDHEPPYPAV